MLQMSCCFSFQLSLPAAGLVSWMRLDELPHVHAGPGARVPAASPGLDRAMAYGSHAPASRTGKMQFAAGELFDLYGAMAVHDLSRGVDLLVRPARENEDSSTPHSLDVGFRLRFGCPDCPEIPVQVHLEVGAWGTH